MAQKVLKDAGERSPMGLPGQQGERLGWGGVVTPGV